MTLSMRVMSAGELQEGDEVSVAQLQLLVGMAGFVKVDEATGSQEQ